LVRTKIALYIMDECEELSELQEEENGECRFGEKWLVGKVRGEYFVSVER
jgi:hypothetical protein